MVCCSVPEHRGIFTSSSLRGADGKQREVNMNGFTRKPASALIRQQAGMYAEQLEAIWHAKKASDKLVSELQASQQRLMIRPSQQN